MAVFNSDDCVARRAPGRTLRQLDKRMSAFVEARFADVGLSYVQWIAIKMVRDHVVESAGDLARELGITTGATTRLIDGLEARGLMARDRGGDDRRVVRLVTTEAGREISWMLHDRVVTAWNEVLVDFSQEEAETLVSLLVRLLAAVNRVTGNETIPAEAAE